MDNFFNFFGSIFGYVLWGFYLLIPNYGVAIILFTIVFKLLLFPFSIKQQRSMAASGKIQVKIQNLQKRYADDKQRLQIETQKLYEKEGFDPTGGCSTMLLPFLIMFGIYYTVLNPLSNALHLSADAISKALGMMNQIPGYASVSIGRYSQIEIVRNFANLKPYLTMFSGDEIGRLQSFSHGFKFLGLDLLGTPCDAGNIFGTLFRSNLWIIPALCLVSSVVTQYFSMKMQPVKQQQGCMTFGFYMMALFSAWWACTIPAAVGFYWIISNVMSLAQVVVMNTYYSPDKMNAETEARRIALREQQEAAVRPLSLQRQVLLQKKLGGPEKRSK